MALDLPALLADLKRDEGTGPMHAGRHLVYSDTRGKLTIGYGHNLSDKGITAAQAERLLHDDVTEVVTALEQRFPWWTHLNEIRQRVLVEMAFNLGLMGLLGFQNTLAAIERGEYQIAAEQLLDSLWAKQVGSRATRLAEMMRRGAPLT